MKTTLKKPRRSSEEGAIIVELIVVVPIYILLWLFANYAYGSYTLVLNNVSVVRDCAWTMASSRCDTRPGSCTVNGPIPEPPASGAIGSALGQVTSTFVALTPTLRGPFGNGFRAEKSVSLPGPPALGLAAVTTRSVYAAACDEKLLPPLWTTETLFLASCEKLTRYCF